MAGIYDGPYNHDCGWLECTVWDCPQARRNASATYLIDCNITRDGELRGLPSCGDTHWYERDYVCLKSAGHVGKHSERGCPWGGWA